MRPARWTRTGAVGALLLCLLAPTAIAQSPLAIERSGSEASRDRARQVRRALQGVSGHGVAAADRLAKRVAPESLSILVVGCDFSDSLMVGRDRSQFPGWPPSRRTAQPILYDGNIPQFEAHDAAFFDLQMQRVDDYWRTVSLGRFGLDWQVHETIVNLPEAMGWYGDADSADVRIVRMANQVVAAIDDEVDFSLYDTLLLIHAGAGQETDVEGDSPEQLFSNYLDARDFEVAVEAGVLASPWITTGEGALEHVLVLPESEAQDPLPSNALSGFFDVRGVYCFEIGLRLGMLSLADFTPSQYPDSQGIGNFGLMGYGLFTGIGIVPSAPSAMNRYLMGWVDAVEVTEDADIRIGATGAVGDAVSDTLLVRVPISDREYWLIEYRLQDPDGDLFYTFDDLNGNVWPDFLDADSAFENGVPTSTFDPETDTWERELGAEWDYFMSENPARGQDRCRRGGGSGLYIWHIDERVIAEAILGGTNTVNADPDRKGVDVEEADGIQDLDSSRPSQYLLGSDGDVWRGEGVSEFGPFSLPATVNAEGLATGIRITDISHVVVDTLVAEDGDCIGFDYAPTMTFSVRFGEVDGEAATLASQAHFDRFVPRGDLRVTDLGSAPGDPTPDGADEIALLGDDGLVYAFAGSLAGWLDDGLPDTPAGQLANLGAGSEAIGLAVVAMDGSGPAVFVASFSGGDAVVDPQTGNFLAGAPTEPRQGPPVGVEDGFVQLYAGQEEVLLRHFRSDPVADHEIAIAGSYASGPVLLSDEPLVLGLFVDGEQGSEWVRVTLGDSGSAAERFDVPMEVAVDALTVFDGGGRVLGRALDGRPFLLDSVDGSLVASALDAGLPASSLAAAASERDGTDFVIAQSVAGELHVYGRNLRDRVGFPYRPARVGESYRGAPAAMPPALVDLDGDGRIEVLWHDPTGEIHAVDLEGRSLAGWPVAGPAEPISAPALADVDGDAELELVVLGRFDRIAGTDAPSRDYQAEPMGDLRVYDLAVPASAYAPWSQARAAADGSGRVDADVTAPTAGDALTPESLLLWPNPVRGDVARASVEIGRDVDVRFELFNLEGERVYLSGWVPSVAGSRAAEDLPVADLASGMYLCRVEAGDDVLTAVLAVIR